MFWGFNEVKTMIEILYNAIHLTAQDNNTLYATITDNEDEPITSGDCFLVIPSVGLRIKGICEAGGAWRFEIPQNEGRGRAEYHIELDGVYLDFVNAVYFD